MISASSSTKYCERNRSEGSKHEKCVIINVLTTKFKDGNILFIHVTHVNNPLSFSIMLCHHD